MRILSTLVFVLSISILFSCKDKTEITCEPNVVNSSKPNIMLIIGDDIGLDSTPGYDLGTEKPNMPNLQELMNNGIRFNNLWSNPTCTPTRSSIMTGKYGIRTNMLNVGDVLSTNEISLQKYLDQENTGYSHAVVGKWHLSNDANHPTNMGIGYYAGLLTGGTQSYSDWNFTANGQTNNSTEYITSKFSDLAVDWLDDQTEPWFLWLAYTAPHTPFHLPPADLHTVTGLPDDQASIDANPLPYYLAMMEAMDTEMGRVINSLSQEELDNTIIIFIGDNGTPGEVSQEFANNRAKGTVFQGGINVPMIISGKGVTRVNVTENALINTTDLFATIASIAGINVTDINDSQSFKNLLTDESASSRKYVYSEIGDSPEESNYTIRNATHKYIQLMNGSERFYDLSQNPLESPNLLNPNQLPLTTENESILNELQAKLAEIRQ